MKTSEEQWGESSIPQRNEWDKHNLLFVLHNLGFDWPCLTSSHCLYHWPCISVSKKLHVLKLLQVDHQRRACFFGSLRCLRGFSGINSPFPPACHGSQQLTQVLCCTFHVNSLLYVQALCVFYYYKKKSPYIHENQVDFIPLRPHILIYYVVRLLNFEPWSTFSPLFVMSHRGVPTHATTDAYVRTQTHTNIQFTQEEGVMEAEDTFVTLAGRQASHSLGWWPGFLHGGWVSPRLCCLVTVRSRLWFMQIGRQGLVGQPWYVVRPSLGQCTKASQQKQSCCI